MTFLAFVCAIAVAGVSIGIFVALSGRRRFAALEAQRTADRKLLDELSAMSAAIPTEGRAIRHGSQAFELDLRGRVHHLANRIVGCDERIAELREHLGLEPMDPSRTATGPIDVPPDGTRHDSDEDLNRGT